MEIHTQQAGGAGARGRLTAESAKRIKCFRRRLLTCPPPNMTPPHPPFDSQERQVPLSNFCFSARGWGPKRAWFLVSRSLDCFPSWGWNNNASTSPSTSTSPARETHEDSNKSRPDPQKRVGRVLFYERGTISVIVMTEIWWPRPLFGQSDVCVSVAQVSRPPAGPDFEIRFTLLSWPSSRSWLSSRGSD